VISFVDAHVHPPLEAFLGGPAAPFLPGITARGGRRFEVMDAAALADYYRSRDGAAVLFGWDDEWTTNQRPLSSADIAAAVGVDPGVLVGLGGVDPLKGAAAVGQVHQIARLGLAGMALHPAAQGFNPSDRTTNPVWEAAAEHDLICVFHTGATMFGADSPGGGGLHLERARPINVDAVAARLPELRIVLAHGGTLWLDEAVAVALHKSNVYLCLGGQSPLSLGGDVLEAVRGPLVGRALFGSGFPFAEPGPWIDDLVKLDLPEKVADGLLRANASALFGLEA
jgi:predicted TIM-barrel fold metal-dependent hydrolase